MTYFGFLVRFVGVPIVILALLLWRDARNRRILPTHFHSYPTWLVVLGHIIVAVVYTTPWDNYLVATSVWWYDPAKVTGILGWYVPLEEYTFFVVQTLMSSMLLLWLMRRIKSHPHPTGQPNHLILMPLGGTWLIMVIILVTRWQPGTYLALELAWALPPIIFQIWFGGHILWSYRRLVTAGIALPTLYLAAADAIAISDGIWTISPAQTLNIKLFGILPIEEFIFFLITNVLVVFGVTLVLAAASQTRLSQLLQRARPVT